MSIKTIGEFQQTLNSGKSRQWSQDIDDSSFKSLETPGVNNSSADSKSFGEFLKDSLMQVNSLQNEANVSMERLASGESKNLHETLLAVEKADIAFRTMNQIRTKVLDAYKEIMKMQI